MWRKKSFIDSDWEHIQAHDKRSLQSYQICLLTRLAMVLQFLIWARWMALLFSFANCGLSTGGLGTPFGGMFGMASAGFYSLFYLQNGAGQIDDTSVENLLRNLVSTAENQISSVHSVATGNGDTSIPPITTSSTYQTPTARFYSNPHLLLDMTQDNSFISAFDLFSINVVCFLLLVHSLLPSTDLNTFSSNRMDVVMTTAWYTLVDDKKTVLSLWLSIWSTNMGSLFASI